MSKEFRFYHLLVRNEALLSEVIHEELKLDIEQIRFLSDFGAIYLNGERTVSDVLTKEGDILRVHPTPRRFPNAHRDWNEHVLFEEQDFVIIHKPPMVPTHATLDNLKENALEQLSQFMGQKLLVTHRLDHETQGLLLFAKTTQFQTYFNDLIQEREVTKEYCAWIEKPLEPGLYIDYMKPGKRAPREVSSHPEPGWKRCELEVLSCKKLKFSGSADGIYETRLSLITGRPHQIRVQLASRGNPILGDPMYGKNASSTNLRLCSELLRFKRKDSTTAEFTTQIRG